MLAVRAGEVRAMVLGLGFVLDTAVMLVTQVREGHTHHIQLHIKHSRIFIPCTSILPPICTLIDSIFWVWLDFLYEKTLQEL